MRRNSSDDCDARQTYQTELPYQPTADTMLNLPYSLIPFLIPGLGPLPEVEHREQLLLPIAPGKGK